MFLIAFSLLLSHLQSIAQPIETKTFDCKYPETKESCPADSKGWFKLLDLEAQRNANYCPSELYEYCTKTSSDPAAACLEPIIEFKKLKKDEESLELNSQIIKPSYYENEKVKSFVDLSVIPPELKDQNFLAMISSPKTSEKGISDFKSKYPQHTVVRYQGNANSLDLGKIPADRLLILVSEANTDRWYQFTIPTLEDEKKAALSEINNYRTYNQLSLVVVDKSNVKKPADRPEVFFRDYKRETNNNSIEIHYRPLSDTKGESCLKCHYNGVNPIHPITEKTSPEDQKAIQKLNGKMLEYGMPSNQTAQIAVTEKGKMSVFGPPLGPLNPESRTDEFMNKCAPGFTPDRRAEIKKAMNCTACHNGKSLTSQFDSSIPNLKAAFQFGAYEQAPIYDTGMPEIKKIIVDREAMPPGFKGSKEEREAIYNCLLQEKWETFNSFFKNESCRSKAILQQLQILEKSTPTQAVSDVLNKPSETIHRKLEKNAPAVQGK